MDGISLPFCLRDWPDVRHSVEHVKDRVTAVSVERAVDRYVRHAALSQQPEVERSDSALSDSWS